MEHDDNLDSNGYWDERFQTDSDDDQGPQQSCFFARVAAELMPAWLVREVRTERLSVCDWGCAESAGTKTLSQLLAWNITGVDFSDPAIEKARQNHQQQHFLHENWLDAPERPPFDLVFSSNTLQHYANPWSVFESMEQYAARYVVLLLPYREYERHAEHDVTFDAANIPVAPIPTWILVHRASENVKARDPNYWPGEQILLVYARTERLAQQRFSLADMQVNGKSHLEELQALEDAYSTQQTLLEHSEHLADERARELKAAQSHITDLQNVAAAARTAAEASETTHAQQLAKQQERVHFLEYREHTLKMELQTLLSTLSWRMTAPMRATIATSDWIKKRVQDVQHAYIHGGVSHVLRNVMRYLPKRLRRQPVRGAMQSHANATTPQSAVATASMEPWPALDRHALPDVFIFSNIDWHCSTQRPQHLARELARAGHRVYFVTNRFEDTAEPGFSMERLGDNLALYQIKLNVRGAPAIYFAPPTPEALNQILAGMTQFRRWSRTDRSWSLVQHAYWYPVALPLQSDCLIYDCMDHHEGFGNVPEGLLSLEEQIMRRADMLVATSSWLETLARKYNRHVQVIRNAGQYADFCHAPAERYVDPEGRKIIGYYGAIAEWFDDTLIADVAKAFPDALVLLVGADTVGLASRLKSLNNVVFTGEVPYARLPYYLYAFDVCLLPFKVILLTLATNPVKIYEYLSAGRAVVSVDLPELAQFGDLTRVASDREDFIDQIRTALAAQPEAASVVAERKAFAEGQTWTHRVQELRTAIGNLPRPKVSAVVLTYNNLGLTKDCLDSLEKYSGDVDLEVVLVDNASSDGTPDFLTAWAASRSNVQLILNADNKGFACGNNQGLAAAKGDYLVILNNDTVVSEGWAWRLANHLRNDPEIGIIGPVTNNIGNEAKIEVRYDTLEAMQPEARSYTHAHLGQWFELNTVAFFCAMLPRSTYERCGPICEDYGVGFFEDDDYCRMVQSVGLKVACAEDAFVHHHLSASFNKLGAQRKRALMEKNRGVYEAKWGPWTPHKYRGE